MRQTNNSPALVADGYASTGSVTRRFTRPLSNPISNVR